MIYNLKMDFKNTVKEGYHAIADRYLDASCDAGVPIGR